MKNELMIFEGSNIDLLTKEEVNFEFNGDVLFSGKQVAEVLEYANSSQTLSQHVDDDCKHLVKNSDISKRYFRKLNNAGEVFIDEDGVIDLTYRSNMKKAKEFRSKVREIVKQVRKTGRFDIVEQNLKLIEDKTERDLSIGLYSIEKALELNPNDIGLAISYNKNKADLDVYLQNRKLETLQDEIKTINNEVKLANEKVDNITMVGNRASFNAEVKSIAKSSGVSHSEIYGLIYKRMKDSYSIDVRARSQNLKKQIQDDRIKLGRKPYQESTMKGKGQPVDIIERDDLWHEASQCLNSVKLDLKQEVVF